MTKLVNVSGSNATVTDAKLLDILTTSLNSDKALTGTYKYLQLGTFFLAGMWTQNYRNTGSINPIKVFSK